VDRHPILDWPAEERPEIRVVLQSCALATSINQSPPRPRWTRKRPPRDYSQGIGVGLLATSGGWIWQPRLLAAQHRHQAIRLMQLGQRATEVPLSMEVSGPCNQRNTLRQLRELANVGTQIIAHPGDHAR